MNYEKLMSYTPTSFGKMVNSAGQEIEFLEHPLRGDEAQVIAVCHALKLAQYSGFYEIDDMINSYNEYEPSFIDGKLYIGDFQAD